jgi:ATP-dependent DNA helicase PIF1
MCTRNFLWLLWLEKIYRQKDEGFIKLLNGVRNRTITGAELAQLNIRLDHAFQPPQHELWIALTPTNAAAQTINAARLANLKEKEFSYEASSNGGFDRTQVPVDGSLALKKGAQVMMANNDREGRWVNGTIGRIEKIKKGRNGMPDAIFVKFADSSLGTVMPHTWELFEYQYNDEKKDLDTKITGSFTQYPLRLAWAVTIHKSQGKTFDRVIIDMDRGAFAHGQTYVALSRCRTLEGIVLKRPIMKHHILVDSRVSDFVSRFA